MGPIFNVIRGGASGILSFILGPTGSETACLASLSFFEKKDCSRSVKVRVKVDPLLTSNSFARTNISLPSSL